MENKTNNNFKKVKTAPNLKFIGRDGREYSSAESAEQAEDPNLKFIGDDGREYSSWEAMEEANKREAIRRLEAAKAELMQQESNIKIKDDIKKIF